MPKTKSKQNKRVKVVQSVKRYGIYFLHSRGWAYIEEVSGKSFAIRTMEYNRQRSPSFKYKVIPVLISPITNLTKKK